MAKSNILTRSKKQRALELLRAGQFALAKDLLEELCRLDRRDPETWYLLGHAREQLGLHAAAEECYRQVVALQPRHPDAHFRLGNVLLAQGRHGEAEASLRRATEVNTSHIGAWSNLGVLFEKTGDYRAAAHCHEKALTLDPAQAALHYNVGNARMHLGEYAEAEPCYRRALALAPQMELALYNLALCLTDQGRLSEAIATYEELLARNPRHDEAFENLQAVRLDQGCVTEAIAGYRAAIRRRGCRGIAYRSLLHALNYDDHLSQQEISVEHRRWGETCAPAVDVGAGYTNDRNPQRRLRIGYVSPDFRAHSVASFIEALLRHHDRAAFETVCYAEVARPDGTTERLKGLAAHWRTSCGLSDEALARAIREDRIDILVDLAGHTRHSRVTAFARKPAPIQVTYLGYPNTTGLAQIDYRLTDELADPAGQEAFHTERLVRLPRCFLCYTPPPTAPPVGVVPASISGEITFGSFNNIAKVNARVVALWCEILRAVPRSRLVLKGKPFADDATAARFREAFARHAIEAERLTLAGWAAARNDHLAMYNGVDIALDPFPYNGTATTCEALWMGVPVVVLEGERHAARVGMDLLTHVGLPECIAPTPERYVDIAVRLATDIHALAALRTGLRERMARSPLCDGVGFAREIEAAYRAMWRSWCDAPADNGEHHDRRT